MQNKNGVFLCIALGFHYLCGTTATREQFLSRLLADNNEISGTEKATHATLRRQ
jgi:hypothetical protein